MNFISHLLLVLEADPHNIHLRPRPYRRWRRGFKEQPLAWVHSGRPSHTRQVKAVHVLISIPHFQQPTLPERVEISIANRVSPNSGDR